MRNARLSVLVRLTALFIASIPQPSPAQNPVPFLINYQGELRSAPTDNLVPDGTYDMTFRIYDAQSGGTHVWEGKYSSANGNPIELKDGIFSVLLGSGTGNAVNASMRR